MTSIELTISNIIRLHLKEQCFTYKELAEMLNMRTEAHKKYNENALRSSISRGKLQASDLILILKAIGLSQIELKDFY